jgi:hypothetical protein
MNLNRCQFTTTTMMKGKRIVNVAMDPITEIIRPLFRSAQLYDQDIPVVKIYFGETGVHHDTMTV